MALELRERTTRIRAASPSSAEAATDADQMLLFTGVAPMRQT
jgi:hypothetical protein